MHPLARRLFVAWLATTTAGCVGARPWERETLAQPGMQLEPDALAASMLEHVHAYREGSEGAAGGGGGGCGCN